MGAVLARIRPLAASLFGHAALGALLAGASLLAPAAPGPDPAVVPVRRVSGEPGPAAPRLVLGAGDGAGPGVPGAEQPSVALDTADPRYRPYLLGVRRRIWERWGAPGLAPGEAARGTLVVEFTLTRSGALAGSGVRETSGVAALDRAALAAVAGAVPFGPLPESVVGDSLRVRARFTYD